MWSAYSAPDATRGISISQWNWWPAAVIFGGIQAAAILVGNVIYPRMQAETQNIDPVATLVAATAQAADTPAEANKKLVLAFYDAALVKRDVDAAVKYLGAKHIQHNPNAPDGAEGVKGLVKFLAEQFPNRSSDIKRVIAEGDLVVLHVHAKPNPRRSGQRDRRHLPRRERQDR